jgi:TolB protein
VISITQPVTSPNSWPDWSPDGSQLVYAGAGSEGFDLYLMEGDGSDITQITDAPGDEYTPAWSPDGSRILFGFDDGAEAGWRSGLATVAPDGTSWTELYARHEERVGIPAWSPDGRRIAFTVFGPSGSPQPFVADADGANLSRLIDGPGAVASWTPDGARVVISAEGAIITVRPDGSGKRVLLDDPPEGGRAGLVMDWSPDGDWIVMSSPFGIGHTLYLLPADANQVFTIGTGTEPSWRPESS